MKKILTLLALALASASSYGQAYFQGNIGATTMSVQGVSNDSTSYGLGFGYQITPTFALDLSYTELYSEPGLTSNGVFLRGIVSTPINSTTNLNFRLGVGSTTVNLYPDKAKGKITFGIGGETALNNKTSLGAVIDYYQTDSSWNLNKTSQINLGFYMKLHF